MKKYGLLIGLFVAAMAHGFAADTPLALSPDQRVHIEVSLRKLDDKDNRPHYRVLFDGREVIRHSSLGMSLEGTEPLGGPCEIVTVTSKPVLEAFTQVSGKRRDVRVNMNETTITLRERSGSKRTWQIQLRAANDGVAFRYLFPKQDGWDALTITQEQTQFRVLPEAKAFALPLNGYTTSYEKRYQRTAANDLAKDSLLGLPLLLECPGGVWAAITEANMNEFAGLYLAPTADGVLESRLSPSAKEPKVAVKHTLPHVSPWRVILIGDRLGSLVESDSVLALNPPCAIADTSWIKTGKTTFPWWNGFYEENVPFKPGLNTATAKHYIDFCAEAGIPYHSLDGVGNTAWYSGPIVPYQGAEPTKGIDGLDLQEVLKHAKAKGVRIRLWMHWKAAETHMEKAFPLYQEWGIEGVMLDFMDRDHQEMNRFVRKAVALAAKHQLTVTLHGCPKPTGMERTYPNLLSHEGVMNLEYDKWDKVGITADHETTIPFTRMLAGPLDFHQGSFRTVKPEAFKPQNAAPLVMGTPARTLASYVVYQNHLSMVADYPTAYRGHPALPVLAAIPTTWDDTKVLEAKPGEVAVIARRSGKAWHIGAMNDGTKRTIKVPLAFLGDGTFAAISWVDAEAVKYSIARREVAVSATDTLTLELDRAGGAYVRLMPVK